MPNLKKEFFSNLRAKMRSRDIDALIIFDSDPHLGEYIAGYWKIREWISGFSGSNGVIVLTLDHIGLWTDSRYFIQGETELRGTGIELHRMLKPNDHYQHWIINNLEDNATIGFDGRLISVKTFELLKDKSNKKRFGFDSDALLIDDIWVDSRPKLPKKKVFLFDDRYAGTPRKNKIEEIRRFINDKKGDWLLITALDEIAWLFNLRGRDIDFNPVFYAYALVGLKDSYLFIDGDKLPEAVRRVLENDNVFIEDYEKAYSLNDLSYGTVLLDTELTNVSLYKQLRSSAISRIVSPIQLSKAKKSPVEVQHIQNAMIKDGQALCHAFHWLTQNVETGISEYDFAQHIASCRKKQLGYYGESFPAIVGYKENGAIVHYRPADIGSLTIYQSGLLLCDSGGQYLDGTTDITRTICLGTPTDTERRAYTLVLKGHIALATAIFPRATTGSQLDVLARQYLWNDAKDYGHGTGHGVGYFLNVHEGPQGISPRSKVSLEPGMIISNEPGYYEEGAFGIRIENLILVEECVESDFLKFRTISYYPIQSNLIIMDLMTQHEIEWLNRYHKTVYKLLSDGLEPEMDLWLSELCQPL